MKVKKILTAVLALTMLFALAACGNSKNKTETKTTDETASSEISMDELQAKMDEKFNQMNEVMDAHADLWNVLSMQDDDVEGIGSEYMEILLEKHGDLVSDEEREALKEDVEKVRDIEAELEKLGQQYTALVGGGDGSESSDAAEDSSETEAVPQS